MPDDLLREQIRTQIEVTRDFTKELVDVNKFLKDLKEIDSEILNHFHNGLVNKVSDKIKVLLENQAMEISKRTCDIVAKKIDGLYWRFIASVGVLTAIFSFIVYIVNLLVGK